MPPHPDPTGGLLLGHAVRAALHALSRAAHPDGHPAGHTERSDDARPITVPACIEQYLRAALAISPATTGYGPYAEAAQAVDAACADLDAGDLHGAYFALRTAHTALSEASRDDAATRR